MEKTQWIDTQINEWAEVGNECRLKRKEIRVSAKAVASLLGVSVNRIYRFEKGQPIRDAKLLENAYLLALDSISNCKGDTIIVENLVDNKVVVNTEVSLEKATKKEYVNSTKAQQNTVFNRLLSKIFG
ncbi:helix-turn-helix domain-containing protein [Lysinibacillus endophyticus]|uniref:helix-turn-helix domain-containing protein n=1 Tax=Ureibacillus endophyticus TaxID=1978490 RepID=UPI00209E88BD|nr:helix-turn-helix transcriptional regulator [Lysinibacillus endophyticus]MCP1146152.1 helix-turn-helix domain-containing protein [Lysinibacillus endophyticus]